MPRFLLALIAGILVAFTATPAEAKADNWSSGSSWSTRGYAADAFAQSPLADEELSAVHGTAVGSMDFMKNASRDHAVSYGSQTAGALSVQFDNWLNDVAAPLIADNLLSP